MLPGKAPCGISCHSSRQRRSSQAFSAARSLLDILLHLALLPSGGRIAELGLEHVVAGHRQEPSIDLALLALADAVNSGAHVVVDAPRGNTAEDPEGMTVGIEQHLVGLQQIGPQQECPAVRQLDMRHLQLGALAAQNGPVLAPVELEGLAGREDERHEGPAPRGLQFPMPIRPPLSCKGGDPVVGTGEAQGDKIGVQLLDGAALLARLAGLGLQPTRQLRGIRIELARPLGHGELRLN